MPARVGRDGLAANERKVLARMRSVKSTCVRPVFVNGDRVVIRWIFEDGGGQSFPGSPAFEEGGSGCHAIGVNIKCLDKMQRIGKTQYDVIKGRLSQQFLPDDDGQASTKPELECAREDEASSIKPSAAIIVNKWCMDLHRVSKSVEAVVHIEPLSESARLPQKVDPCHRRESETKKANAGLAQV